MNKLLPSTMVPRSVSSRLARIPFMVGLYNRLRGLRIHRTGPGHRFIGANARLPGTRIEFIGRGGWVELGNDVRLIDCDIMVRGTSPRLVIGANVNLTGVRIVVEDRGSRLYIGPGTSMTGAILQAKESGLVEIGAGCMIGHGTEVNNSDSHSLLDATSGARLNPARDVVIGDHVWVGSGVWVAKGARIGAGSVVAARSRVVGTIAPGVLVAGSPAVVKRTDVTWDRSRRGVER